QAGDDLGFAFESLLANRIFGKMLREDLDGHRTLQTCVSGAVDLTHPTRTDGPGDFIRSESSPYAQRHLLISFFRVLWSAVACSRFKARSITKGSLLPLCLVLPRLRHYPHNRRQPAGGVPKREQAPALQSEDDSFNPARQLTDEYRKIAAIISQPGAFPG